PLAADHGPDGTADAQALGLDLKPGEEPVAAGVPVGQILLTVVAQPQDEARPIHQLGALAVLHDRLRDPGLAEARAAPGLGVVRVRAGRRGSREQDGGRGCQRGEQYSIRRFHVTHTPPTWAPAETSRRVRHFARIRPPAGFGSSLDVRVIVHLVWDG